MAAKHGRYRSGSLLLHASEYVCLFRTHSKSYFLPLSLADQSQRSPSLAPLYLCRTLDVATSELDKELFPGTGDMNVPYEGGFWQYLALTGCLSWHTEILGFSWSRNSLVGPSKLSPSTAPPEQRKYST